MKEKLIEVKNLKVSFLNGNKSVQIIRGFDIHLYKGEILGILGESGSGKTVSSSTLLKLMDKDEGTIDAGEILFKGKDILKLNENELEELRGKSISYVFQDPSQALNPYKRIGKHLIGILKNHGLPYSKRIVINSLKEVGLDDPETIYDMYPFQLSGGQNQRIMICQCIICKPDLLIADEPTSSVDASLRKKILELLIQINKKFNMAIMIITHDFDIVKYLCDRLVIMYGGVVVEEGKITDVLEEPLHPYTKELIKCARSLDLHEETLYFLEGMPLTPHEFRNECPFYKRCKIRTEECLAGIPEMQEIENRIVRCLNIGREVSS